LLPVVRLAQSSKQQHPHRKSILTLEGINMTVMTPPGIKTPGDYIEDVMTTVKAKNPAEPEFHQAVLEVLDSLRLVLQKHPEYPRRRFWSVSPNLSAS